MTDDHYLPPRSKTGLCPYAERAGIKLICSVDETLCKGCRRLIPPYYPQKKEEVRDPDPEKCYGLYTCISPMCRRCPMRADCMEDSATVSNPVRIRARISIETAGISP